MTRAMSQQPNGIHHIAIMAADIKTHIAFFSEVLGFPLVALFDMHGVPGGLHAFLRMHDYGYFSIVQLPAVADIPIEIGRTHSGSGALPSAAGTLQHLAQDREADVVHPAAAVRLGDRGTQEPLLGHAVEDLAMDLALFVPLADVGQDLGLGEGTGGGLDELVLVGQGEIDHAVHPTRRQ